MRQALIQILGLVVAATLTGCGSSNSDDAGTTQLGIKFPSRVNSKPMKLLAEQGISQAPSDQDIWTSNFEPANTGELNCFGVIIGGSGLSGKTCQDNNSGGTIPFGLSKMGALLGDTLSIDVPANGTSRNIRILGWKANSEGACKSLVKDGDEAKKVDVNNLSHPYIIGVVNVNLQPGPQTVAIDATFNPSNKLVNCDIFEPDVNSRSILQKTIGGTVEGFSGEGSFFITNNGGDEIEITGNGPFAFPQKVDTDAPYEVKISQQPNSEVEGCFVVNGSGNAAEDVNDIEVVCDDSELLLEGSATGLVGALRDRLILEVFRNGELINVLDVNEDGGGPIGNFKPGDQYEVVIVQQPTLHTCVGVNEVGSFQNSNLPVEVVCTANGFQVGVTVSGLSEENEGTLVIHRFVFDEEELFASEVGQDIAIDTAFQQGCDSEICFPVCGPRDGQKGEECENFDFIFAQENDNFVFPALQADQTGFFLEIFGEPPGYDCRFPFDEEFEEEFEGAGFFFEGFIDGEDVLNIPVTCELEEFFVFGSLSGHPGEAGNPVLTAGGVDFSLLTSGDFTHPQPFFIGDSAEISIAGPAGFTCTIDSGEGQVDAINFDFNFGSIFINVSCVEDTFTVGGNITGLGVDETISLELFSDGEVLLDTIGVTNAPSFVFNTQLLDGDGFFVSVLNQPEGKTCEITEDDFGQIQGQDFTSIEIECTEDLFLVGGTVSNSGSETITVTETVSGASFPVASGSSFPFTAIQAVNGTNYNFVATGGAFTICNVTNDSGTVNNADVNDVNVDCFEDPALLDPCINDPFLCEDPCIVDPFLCEEV